MFATLKINKQKMKHVADSGHLGALDVAESLVKLGLPFRTAHKIVGNLVQTAHESKKSLTELTLAEIAKSVKEKEISGQKILKIISSINSDSSLKKRSSLGSAGISEQKRMIANRKTKARKYRAQAAKNSKEVSIAVQKLSEKTRSLTK
jgi:argininosuccinate lyase